MKKIEVKEKYIRMSIKEATHLFNIIGRLSFNICKDAGINEVDYLETDNLYSSLKSVLENEE